MGGHRWFGFGIRSLYGTWYSWNLYAESNQCRGWNEIGVGKCNGNINSRADRRLTDLSQASPASAANTSSTQTLKVSNTGGSNLSVTSATASGNGFSVTGASFPITVSAGRSVNLSVKFSPTAAGNYSGTITVSSNAGNSAPAVTLSGSATTPVSHSVTLNWTASTSTVVGYFVYRGTQSGGPYVKLQSASVPGTSFTDTTAQSGTYVLLRCHRGRQ